MAFVFHIHPAPSCEPTQSTSCALVEGSDWEHSCFQIVSGRNRGKYACVHRHPEGLSHEDEIFISDLISQHIFARGQGGYAQMNRP
jgi:hypothetical protein